MMPPPRITVDIGCGVSEMDEDGSYEHCKSCLKASRDVLAVAYCVMQRTVVVAELELNQFVRLLVNVVVASQ